ncbi:DUF1697 domain-containing protein [Microbacterium sp. SS28]|uniref:DUF1697 domain-containing protein n=1 Tax=Microbacterium sp. SS28 TaxID=2919948 RepID=UPI001FA9810F|nr:DUF1697 domain-containing protein [Microbacterium sp. SS28]
MTAWVALLRGVNVGGVAIRSADLAEVFRGLGFASVRTVLASGNVAFEADAGTRARATLQASIEEALGTRFGYEAHILLITRDELTSAIDDFPFDASDADRQPWVVFCADTATRDELAAAAASLDPVVDPVATGPGVVYWNPVKGTTTDTPFAKVLAKRTFAPRTTNRNLRTLGKILG